MDRTAAEALWTRIHAEAPGLELFDICIGETTVDGDDRFMVCVWDPRQDKGQVFWSEREWNHVRDAKGAPNA